MSSTCAGPAPRPAPRRPRALRAAARRFGGSARIASPHAATRRSTKGTSCRITVVSGSVILLLGIANFNEDRLDSARKAFEGAAENEKQADSAQKWLNHVEAAENQAAQG